ncbi:ParA family protein [Deinococcus misasensis]|uniref:ParA family protein n=1 Tax=Deinococcus misasensis TaxID=392413 RepID=UPI00054F3967|nr:ParA family protein [Deinococcus misasensis]
MATNQKFVMVASGKGGVGKTTTTVHLAYLLQGVIVDLDPKQSTQYFSNLKSPVIGLQDTLPEGMNVIVDLPPSAELVQKYAQHYAAAMTHVIIPVQPTAEDYALARNLHGIFSVFPRVKVGILLNFLGNDRDSKIAPSLIKDTFKWDLIGQIGYKPAVFRSVRAAGISIDSVDCYMPTCLWVNS